MTPAPRVYHRLHRKRLIERLSFVGILLWSQVALAGPADQAGPGLEVLTSIRQVNELNAEAAARHYPVHLRAVVSGLNADRACFLNDGSGAIYYSRPKATEDLIPGQVVEIDAISQEGNFSSQLTEKNTKVVGAGPTPKPELLTFDQLALGAADCHSVELGGIIRRVEYIKRFGCLDIQLATTGGILRVYLFHPPDIDGTWLVDAKVRMRGVVSSRFNQNRQWLAARLNVDGMDNVTVEVPAPKDPFSIPARPAKSLARFEPQSSGFAHRIKVIGVVLYHEPGKTLYLRDGEQPLMLQTRQIAEVGAGDVVEAIGFLNTGAYSAYLEDVLFRKIRDGTPPAPVRTSAKNLLMEGHDADLVIIEADLLNAVERGDEETLVLQDGNVLFNAQFIRQPGAAFLPVMRNGSRLRLMGICSIQETEEKSSTVLPEAFRLKLPSPRSVWVVNTPSWWTSARLLRALAAMVLIVALGACWIWLLRRRVTEQTNIILQKAQREAVLEERTRIARDFHDTLEQELAGLTMQLDAVGRKFDQSPPTARPSLELARRMLMHCRVEAKRSVWDLRCIALEQGDLVAALHEVCQPIVAGHSITLNLHVEGDIRRLPGSVERDLLRIGQEAVTNAAKHAVAKQIDVIVGFADQDVTLTVIDDGCGFNPAERPAVSSGHFGLAGMNERAAKLGGTLAIESKPGEGTKIFVNVPVHDFESSSADHPDPPTL